MGALIIALVPILELLLKGAAVEVAFQALTVPQWAAIGAALINLAQPEISSEIAKLHPLFDQFINNLPKWPLLECAENAVKDVEKFFGKVGS